MNISLRGWGNSPSKELEIRINSILSVTFLFIASVTRVTADPPLKANPDPIVVPAEQTPSTPSGGVTASRRRTSFPFILNVQVAARASFGDPALGALGNPATGTGSLKIRDSPSAAGQRGFNASVKLHLSRKY